MSDSNGKARSKTPAREQSKRSTKGDEVGLSTARETIVNIKQSR
jgi:hypothetical protein